MIDALERIQCPKPRPVIEVSRMFDNLLRRQNSFSSSSLHDQIRKIIEPVKPFIFGSTPMCKALTDAIYVFRGDATTDKKVLFILSDGESRDGDPRKFEKELRGLDVIIITCFLTSEPIRNPRCLFDPKQVIGRSGKQVLFEMSSTMKNMDAPITYLIDANWELPPSGESRLFLQANSLDVVNEFCKIVVSKMAEKCDDLVYLLEKLPLATYINQSNVEFKPKEQEEATCYANAIAAVFHLAMHRIVGREGGIPDFYEIRKRIIDEYGVKGANTEKVLAKVCPEYRLHFSQVDEIGARQAINKRRPVIARFSLYAEQWTKFSKFYKSTPKGILNKNDITGE